MQNYFDIFDFPTTYLINKDLLETNYFKLLKKFHPDNFKEASDRKKAYHNTITINKAYRTLREDYKRASYLLELQDVIIDNETNKLKTSEETLIDVLNKRELLDDLEKSDELTEFLQASIAEFDQISNIFNEEYNSKELDLAAQTAIKMRYQEKLISEIKNKLHEL